MNKNLNEHVKSDKAKWLATAIVMLVMLALIGGLIASVVTDTRPQDWINKQPVESGDTTVETQSAMGVSSVAPMFTSGGFARTASIVEDTNYITSDNYGDPLTLLDGVLSGNYENYLYKLSIGFVDVDYVRDYVVSFTQDFMMWRADNEIAFLDNNDTSNAVNFDVSSINAINDIPVISICYDGTDVYVEYGNERIDSYCKQGDVEYLYQYILSNIAEFGFSFETSDIDIDTFVIEEKVAYEANNVVPLPPAPTKEGYTFTGWYLDEACTQLYQGTEITSDMSLYAGWKINTYKVTFNSDGGSNVATQTVDWNTSAKLSNPTKTGYTFKGWYLADGTQYTNQPIKENTTLTAKWQVNNYTVTFNSDGGSAVANQSVEYNKPATLSTPTKEGYNFMGWYLANGTQYTNQAITANTTLKAKWEIKKMSVAFDSNGGSVIADKTVDYGQSVKLETPEREGYDFKGWYLANGKEYTNQPIKANTTLKAKWEIKHFTVTFYVDGEVYTEVAVDYGQQLKEVADKAEVFSQNILSYTFVDETEVPEDKKGEMVVVGDMEVEATAPTETDEVVGKVKNNWLPILLGCVGIVLVIVIIALCVSKKKRR